MSLTLRKSVLIALLLLTAIIAANAAYYWLAPKIGDPEPPQTAGVKPSPASVPPPMDFLGHGARMPTSEELEDEARYNDRQVAKASESLNDSSPEKRVGGVEQLSAFPTPESEQLLINTLGLDFDPEVRRAAAQSLGAFKLTSPKAVTALLTALQDDSEAVQIESMNSLIRIAGKMVNGSAASKALLANLGNQTRSKRMKPEVRKTLRAFVQDQQPSSFSSDVKK